MVEKSVDELENINKKAVESLPNIPKDGVVDIEANVKEDKAGHSVEVIKHSVSEIKNKNSAVVKSQKNGISRKSEPTQIKEEKVNVPIH